MANDDDVLSTLDGSDLSDNDKRFLSYLTLTASVIQRQLNPAPPSDPPKTFWMAFREPTVVAALITVLIGGIAATLITGIIQWRAAAREFKQGEMARDREFEQAWLKSRGDQALVSYKEYLDQERELITRTYSSIGKSISAADRLTGLTRGVWRGSFVEPAAVEKQKKDIRDNYNQTSAKWHGEAQEIGLLMGYYHPSSSSVTNSWDSVQKAVDSYVDCAQDWYDKHPATKPAPRDEEVTGACRQKYEALLGELHSLTTSLESARRYAWTGWESPQELRTALYGKAP